MQDAIKISATEYLKLENPIFEGQTRVNENGEYKMYWRVGDKVYYTENSLMS